MALIINGENIDMSLIDREFQQIKSQFEMSGAIQCCERDEEFRSLARNNVVSRALLAQEARRRAQAPAREDVQANLNNLMEQYGGRDRFFARFGLNEADEPIVRRDVETDLWVRRFLEDFYAEDPEPTEAELRAFHSENLGRYMTPEKIHAFHMIKRPATAEEKEWSYAKMRDIRERLLNGGDFAELARTESDRVHELEDGEATPPGQGTQYDLGFFHRGEMMEEMEFVAFSLRVGEVSSIFSTAYGFHLLKCLARIDPQPIAFEEIREKVMTDCVDHRREEKLRNLVQKLKAGAIIVEDDAVLPAAPSHTR